MLALLYDIHGNLPALDAVLADATAGGADGWLLGGDYALFGGWPEETVARLEALDGAIWIRGNGERWSGAPDAAPSDPLVQGAITACRAALGGDVVARLAGLQEQTVLDGTRYCHGSPVSDVRSFLPEPAEDDSRLLAGVTERRLVFGHTHLPFRRQAGEIELVNPGSVGMPFDGDTRAAYALVHPDGTVEHRRVTYDHAASAERVRERFGDAPWTAKATKRLQTATFVV